MLITNPAQHKPSLKQRARDWLLEKLGGVCRDIAMRGATEQFYSGHAQGLAEGRKQARIHCRILPMPFDEQQLSGADYGMFITPAGFGVDAFGECTIPAPGANGYEHRALYVDRKALDYPNSSLNCLHPNVFGPHAKESGALVPVIVTVLR